MFSKLIIVCLLNFVGHSLGSARQGVVTRGITTDPFFRRKEGISKVIGFCVTGQLNFKFFFYQEQRHVQNPTNTL